MQDDLLPGLAQDLAIDHAIVVRGTGNARQRAARHHYRPSALGLDETDLRLIGIDDVLKMLLASSGAS